MLEDGLDLMLLSFGALRESGTEAAAAVAFAAAG
jgi:hypothetical protein